MTRTLRKKSAILVVLKVNVRHERGKTSGMTVKMRGMTMALKQEKWKLLSLWKNADRKTTEWTTHPIALG